DRHVVQRGEHDEHRDGVDAVSTAGQPAGGGCHGGTLADPPASIMTSAGAHHRRSASIPVDLHWQTPTDGCPVDAGYRFPAMLARPGRCPDLAFARPTAP